MNKIPAPLQTIINVALIRYIALSLDHTFFKFDEFFLGIDHGTHYISVFHFAANAICIVALLIAGYWSVLGIASGSTIWNIVHTSVSFTSQIPLFFASVISCFLSLFFYRTFIQPNKETIWKRPSLQSVLIFTFIFTALIVGAAQIAFIRIPEIDPLSIQNIIMMILGNFIAVTIVFVLLNLVMSFYLTIRKVLSKQD